jgi:hypothetical protein
VEEQQDRRGPVVQRSVLVLGWGQRRLEVLFGAAHRSLEGAVLEPGAVWIQEVVLVDDQGAAGVDGVDEDDLVASLR